MKKYILVISVFLLGLFASNWIFNHIYAWAGVASYILTFGLTLRFFYIKLDNVINNSENEEE